MALPSKLDSVQFKSVEVGAIECGSRPAGVINTGLIKVNSPAIKRDWGLSARAKNQQVQVGLHEMA